MAFKGAAGLNLFWLGFQVAQAAPGPAADTCQLGWSDVALCLGGGSLCSGTRNDHGWPGCWQASGSERLRLAGFTACGPAGRSAWPFLDPVPTARQTTRATKKGARKATLPLRTLLLLFRGASQLCSPPPCGYKYLLFSINLFIYKLYKYKA